MKFLLVTIFAILHYSNAINPKQTCTSQNDPHMKNFANTYFEFHQSGEHCMYNSGSVEITAGFSECSPGNPTPTCNCMLRIKILTGVYANQFLVIDTCSSNTWSVQTDTGAVVTCPALMATNAQILLDAWWVNQTSTLIIPGFRCTLTASGATAIKTDFNSNNDALVLGYAGWPAMSSIEVYGSNNYFTTTEYSKDKCLCGQYSMSADADCRKILQDRCFQNVIGKNTELDQLFEKLIQDCKTDFSIFPNENEKIGQANVGLFQKDVFEAKKLELLIQKFNINVNPLKQPGFNAVTWNALTKYCACKGLVPNKECIVNGKCNLFQLCI